MIKYMLNSFSLSFSIFFFYKLKLISNTLIMTKKQDYSSKPKTVWQLYSDFGISGSGKTTIAFFENDQKGLDFINSFEMDAKIEFFDNKKSGGMEHSYYMMQFTAPEAIESGFLDMYKLQYWNPEDTVYVLYLEEIPLNRQLIAVVPEDNE